VELTEKLAEGSGAGELRGTCGRADGRCIGHDGADGEAKGGRADEARGTCDGGGDFCWYVISGV
jgi:hypothetical protein